MHPDLQHLIRLQELDLAAERSRRRIAELPLAQQALEARLADQSRALATILLPRPNLRANSGGRKARSALRACNFRPSKTSVALCGTGLNDERNSDIASTGVGAK